MKAEDLMIGDWVKCTDPGCEGHQVDLIDNGNEEVGLDGEIDNFENIIPIPLTLEILEKNGFEKSRGEKFTWFIYNTAAFDIRVVSEKDNLYDIKIAEYPRLIKYVHELQHALKLCGIDKEIVL